MKKPTIPKLKTVFGKKSVFRYFLISYTLVFLVPVIISIIMYAGTIDISKKETVEKNLMISRQFKYSAEQILIRIENIRTKISADRSLGNLDYQSETISTDERYNLLLEISKLNDYILTENDFIETVYLYRNDKKIALGTNGLFSLERLHHTNFSTSDLKFPKLSDLLSFKDSIYLPYKELTVNGISEEYILCVLPVERGVYYSNWTHILLTLSKDKFAGKIEKPDNNADIFIITKNNEIISLYKNTKDYNINYNDLTDDNNTFTKKTDKNQSIITYLKSDLTDFKYVMIEPVSSYLGNVYYLRFFLVLGFLIAFLIGLFVIMRFAKKNYKEIKNIADLFGEKETDENEFDYINEKILNSINIKQEFDKLIEKTDTLKKDKLLIDLLRGTKYEGLTDEEYTKEILKTFKNDFFTVVVLSPDETGNIYFNEENESLPQKYEEACFIIANTVSEVFGAHITYIDSVMAAIINDDIPYEEILKNLNELIKFYKKNFNITVTASSGTVKTGANSIKSSYEEALYALNYKFVMGKGACIGFHDVKELKSNFVYSLEKEQMLINCAKIGSFEKIEQIIKEIFDVNFKRNVIPVEIAKCFVFDIIGTILKTIPKTSDGEYLIERSHIANDLLSTDTISELEEEILNVFKDICEYNNIVISDGSVNISKDIERYIKNNFKNPDLNISQIAEHFNLSGAYISKLFKTATGKGILDYIHIERINYGKELLKEGISVFEVATLVGYNNSNAFIRVFKKYEKITPGQFISIEKEM